MLAVAFCALLACNTTLVERLCLSSPGGLEAATHVGPLRVACFTGLACLTGTLVACSCTFFVWRDIATSHSAFVRGVLVGCLAGYFAWCSALLLLCIGHGVDGQAPLFAILMSFVGAASNAVPAGLLGLCWVKLVRGSTPMPNGRRH
jgi:hypothetical protein